ncbi:MAG: 3-hydroxyacyl-CoA dehydrogenase [Bacteroidota bacterium]|nr:3-hydroxyacyl-CoA dehydrogenase [Bacteroidota bacterium]
MTAEELSITYRGVIYPYQCDHMGHMNVMWYVGKFDEATWQLVRLFGADTAYMKNNNRGMVAAEQHIFYKRELLAGNLVSVRSGILEVRDKTLRFFHELVNEETNEVAAIALMTGVHIDSGLRKACSLPADLAERAKAMVTSYQPAVK